MQEHGDSIHQRFSAKKGGIEKKEKKKGKGTPCFDPGEYNNTLCTSCYFFQSKFFFPFIYIIYIYNKNL